MTHLALEDMHTSLCSLLSFHPDHTYMVDGEEAACQRCMRALDHLQHANIPLVDVEAHILYATGTTTNSIRHTHYTYDGVHTICGTDIRHMPKWRADDIERPTCVHCLSSPFIPNRYLHPRAQERMVGRGRYDRSKYGLTGPQEK